MTIKDVEKLTGLTAKSIRYYETKGLITVERDKENSYRSYSEEDVHRLKQIKLFRYLDFSIEEIGGLLDCKEEEIKSALRKKAENFSDQKTVCEEKQELCLTLAKDYKEDSEVIEEYNETIDFLESDEMAETMEKIKDYGCPNLVGTIAYTLICLGPIGWLFYNIHIERIDALMLNAAIALLGAAIITGNWIHYIRQYRRHKARVKKNNKEWAWMVPAALGTIVLGIAAFIGVQLLVEKCITPADYLFFEFDPVAGMILIWLIMIPILLACVLVIAKLRKKTPEQMEEYNDIVFIWNHLGKVRPIAIVIWIIAIYLCATSVTVVTEDKIIRHTPINPMGTSYEYSEVDNITTGFGNKRFAFIEYKKKGNFYYQVEIDGKTITFHVPSVNDDIKRYEEDTYLELEEFDQKLVSLGISKKASSEGYENCDLDQEFVDRFLRITKNIAN